MGSTHEGKHGERVCEKGSVCGRQKVYEQRNISKQTNIILKVLTETCKRRTKRQTGNLYSFPSSSFIQGRFQSEDFDLFGPLQQSQPELHSELICLDLEMIKGGIKRKEGASTLGAKPFFLPFLFIIEIVSFSGITIKATEFMPQLLASLSTFFDSWLILTPSRSWRHYLDQRCPNGLTLVLGNKTLNSFRSIETVLLSLQT